MRIIDFFAVFCVTSVCLCTPREIRAEDSDKQVQHQNTQVLKSGSRIVLIGDSLAEGMASHFLKLTKQCNYKGIVYALHSTTTDYWSKKIDKIMIDTRPSLVIVSLGTNDSGAKNPETQRPHIKKIVTSVKKHGSKILWLVPQKLPDRFKSQDKIRQSIIEHSDSFTVNVTLEMAKDQIHLTQKGYKDWITQSWNHLGNAGLLVRLPGVEPGTGAL